MEGYKLASEYDETFENTNGGKLNRKDKIELLGRAGLKYIDEFGVEYFIDSEMIVKIE